MSEREPLVTIVIAVRNGAATLGQCIESVAAQTYHRRELIVIDGASTDGTQAVIQRMRSAVSYWESEPDRGVYHAWNKALARAKGTWICFLGADDYYASSDALTRMVALDDGQVGLISGKMAVVDGKGRVLRIMGGRWDWDKMKRFCVIAHPGLLHRRDLFSTCGGFDESYAIAGDYEFLMRVGKNQRAAFLDDVAVAVGDAGLSRMQVARAFSEVRRLQAAHREIGPTRAFANHCVAWTKYVGRRFVGAVRQRLLARSGSGSS